MHSSAITITTHAHNDKSHSFKIHLSGFSRVVSDEEVKRVIQENVDAEVKKFKGNMDLDKTELRNPPKVTASTISFSLHVAVHEGGAAKFGDLQFEFKVDEEQKVLTMTSVKKEHVGGGYSF